MNDGSVSRPQPKIRTIRRGYAVGDILDEMRISVTWPRGGKRTTAPILSRVLYAEPTGSPLNATLVFRVPRLRSR